MFLNPSLIFGDLGVDTEQSLVSTAQAPGDDPGQEDLLRARLLPHERSPTVALTGVLAPDTARTEHVGSDGVRRHRLLALGGGDHRDGHLLQDGGHGRAALPGDPPARHSQGVADLHPGPRQTDRPEVLEVSRAGQPPHGDVVVVRHRVVLRVSVHAGQLTIYQVSQSQFLIL